MKHLIFTLFIAILLVSCSTTDCSNGVQDGTETDIDCGGDCPPCPPNTGIINNTTFQAILGTWHNSYYKLHEDMSAGGGQRENTFVNLDSDCKVQFTDEPWDGFNNGQFNLYGGHSTMWQCNYPTLSMYSFDTLSNLITGTYLVESVDTDTLHLSTSVTTGADIFLLSSPITAGTTASVDWEVNLASYYPANGEVEIKILANYTVVNTIPITTTQLNYSGTETVNLASSNPNILIQVTPTVAGWSSSNDISFTTKLDWSGVTSFSGTHNFCVGTPCTGYDNMSGNFAQITWN